MHSVYHFQDRHGMQSCNVIGSSRRDPDLIISTHVHDPNALRVLVLLLLSPDFLNRFFLFNKRP